MTKSDSLRKATVLFILITVGLDILALGVIIPVLPRLVESFVGGDTANAARILGIFGTAWAIMQFISAPIVGSLSDRFGRRPIILLSNLGLGLDYILMALAPSISWLFIGRILSGLTAASIPTAFAYIADVTPPQNRPEKFGLIGAAFGVGFVLGPALGGLAGAYDLRLPFFIAAALSLLNCCYGYFVLPESLPLEKRSSFQWRHANPFGSIKLLRSSNSLLLLGLSAFLGSLAHMVLNNVYVLYVTYRYDWTEQSVGLSLALVGLTSAFVQASLIKTMVKHSGEYKTMMLGLAIGTLGFFLYGISDNQWIFVFGIVINSLWGLAGPVQQSLMSRKVSPELQGQLQGAISALRSLASILGPGIFTYIFALFIEGKSFPIIPGAPFFLASLMLLLSFLVCLRIKDRKLS